MSETIEHEAAPETATDTSVRGTLEAAFDQVEAREAEAPEQGIQRTRDELGRFAREERAEEAEAPETPVEATEAPAEAKEAQPEAPKGKEPPSLWSEADKETFRKMPAEVQDIWLRREQEREAHFTRQSQQIAALRRDFQPVAELFEPHREVMRQKGFTPAGIIKGYVETEGGLMDPQKRAAVAAQIIRNYQVDPGEVMRALGWQPPVAGDTPPAPENQPASTAIPPELLNYVQNLGQKVQTWEQQQQQERAWHLEQAQSRIMGEIERFKAETGPDGRPLRPYFAEVEDDMAELAELARKKGGDTPPLQDLYETAVYANPATRGRLLADQAAAQEAQRKASEAERLAEARARAAKAQRASSPVTGAPRTGHAGPKNGAVSVRDSIIAAIDAHS